MNQNPEQLARDLIDTALMRCGKNILVILESTLREHIIRTSGVIIGFDGDFLLKHSFKRNIYFVPLAKNFMDVLNGRTKKPVYTNYTKKELVEFWKKQGGSKKEN
jgi:hypothetical protein